MEKARRTALSKSDLRYGNTKEMRLAREAIAESFAALYGPQFRVSDMKKTRGIGR